MPGSQGCANRWWLPGPWLQGPWRHLNVAWAGQLSEAHDSMDIRSVNSWVGRTGKQTDQDLFPELCLSWGPLYLSTGPGGLWELLAH